MTERDLEFMSRAIALAEEGMTKGAGGPFGAVVVKDGEIVAEGYNMVTSTNDPTAHAEVTAIREACKKLGTFQLTDCVIYTSCEPCPMCLGAIYWARPKKVYYGCTREDAAAIEFDDQFVYEEIAKPMESRGIDFINVERSAAQQVFKKWKEKDDKISY
ncbi:nucleoside deaminase [Fulvivirga maritima]|uniref:nucleoside deaminase n=1 Tax=Fulvivirga maritima TaxID=2904247 RepID=UPI001F15D528|nr:nucleoside deaminase [Fulvivirga maritima]UII24441.1 nucleoside deaminase [Fulvivirga maritima]